ncbi:MULTISPECIES: YihY/virulence factor BrkB family protein [Streptomyces diastaticus group]|uniref:Membrane protein n=1 Tax=Streptomyces gougerotii TaxID=53448 RepID=A0A8H9HGK7_9ACTN|nr:YihY/virulence factor BrkB family protein [Streptomyces gougerotii]GFH79963.1 membrane protein [Streptomyces gougerotii]GGU63899.1 membrane protein [Streptomyces gougerotii]
MDWLTRLPVVGPWTTRLMQTHLWRTYETLDRTKWSQLAAAMTYISFLALFPLLTLVAAVAASTLSKDRQRELQDQLVEQVPGISDQLDISSLVDNAGTVSLIAGALLLFTGVGWVSSIRECLRAVWELPDLEGNPVARKAKDVVVLAGLGAAGIVSLVASTAGGSAVGWIARQIGLDETGIGTVLLRVAAFALAVLAGFLVLLYVLTLLPAVQPRRSTLLGAALIGAVGFELLKLLLGGYISGVASKSMYGAFGVPIALLLWINFTAKLVLVCAAWTATPVPDGEKGEARDEADESGTHGGTKGGPGTSRAPEPGATRARPSGEGPGRPPFQR